MPNQVYHRFPNVDRVLLPHPRQGFLGCSLKLIASLLDLRLRWPLEGELSFIRNLSWQRLLLWSENGYWMCCRFENAVTAAEKASQMDPRNIEVAVLLNNVRMVARARLRGNDLFKSERFTEACLAYGEGLRLDPSNSVLYCNRAACWFKLGQWEKSIEDSNQALNIQPNYMKAILRRAASNSKVNRILILCDTAYYHAQR